MCHLGFKKIRYREETLFEHNREITEENGGVWGVIWGSARRN